MSDKHTSQVEVACSIQALLSAPNPDDPLADNVAKEWKDNEALAMRTGMHLSVLMGCVFFTQLTCFPLLQLKSGPGCMQALLDVNLLECMQHGWESVKVAQACAICSIMHHMSLCLIIDTRKVARYRDLLSFAIWFEGSLQYSTKGACAVKVQVLRCKCEISWTCNSLPKSVQTLDCHDVAIPAEAEWSRHGSSKTL